ncbi:hypothetical protein [Pseudogemmobacter sonorensis]|uniref:hypothetical protein n=1 Tax=Pseudogemmobacter sonorensis TaxID=2989681 RepID=UPI0036D1676C
MNGNDNWKTAGAAMRDGLAEAAGQRITEAERRIAAGSRADTEAEALAELAQAGEASEAAERIIDAGIEAGEAEVRAALRAAYLRGLYTDEPPPAGPLADQTYVGRESPLIQSLTRFREG